MHEKQFYGCGPDFHRIAYTVGAGVGTALAPDLQL
jgi:hypothetical protein